LTAIGVNTKQMLYIASQTVEDIFEKIEGIVAHVRKSNKDRLVTIVVDSVAAASTKSELESDHGKDGFATGKAIIISKAMRKINDMIGKQRIALIFTNQLRVNLQAAMFGDKYITSGGKALQFHASVRLRLKGMGALKVTQNGDPVHIGVKTRAVVVKNRLGPPMRYTDFNIYYDSGVDNYGNWIEVLKKYSHISGAKSPYNYTRNNGEVVKIDAKTFAKDVKADAELREELYQKIVESTVMAYKSPDSEIREDVELDESEDEGDTGSGEE
jgi:recombination protein RecA